MLTSGIAQQRKTGRFPLAGTRVEATSAGLEPGLIPKLAGGRGGHEGHQPNPAHLLMPMHAWSKELPAGRDFCGDQSGATFAGALQVCAGPRRDHRACMFADTVALPETPLFADVPVDMTPEEWRLRTPLPAYVAARRGE